ncbi:helix-turn-helix domain-containing protein [Umezawaea sp. Da 62-37]|uniref:TetR/AcrR family transcriptional regulator n=1 Tax=Umezawaea sp. Da 62-37 TaxID=3075927 RepID=UPI0028F730EE|nr:helix-turn-helix domain-containing protein [Umezawaea sp. Da 62-37]WNV86848.1 helix-turn-helix domain-containing protein [Umezawaea sp. Da 62-37]
MTAGTSDGAGRPPRADARRNRAKLLDVAAEVFATRGTDASLDEIAKRAGVGPGTLYRHFPTRQDLLVALLRDSVDALAVQAAELLAAPSPGAALTTWLEAVARHARTYRGLAGVLITTGQGPASNVLAVCHHDMRAAGAALVERAKDADAVRRDVELDEVFQLVNAVALAGDQDDDPTRHTRRLLTLVLEGLRPR